MVVAIPTLAAGEALRECVASLACQTYRNLQVVVVDNSGMGLVKRERLDAAVLEMPRNVGFGAAVNHAWEAYPAPLLATLNDDAVASPEWLGALVNAAEEYPNAGMFASRVVLAGSDALDSAGMLLCADGSSKQCGHGAPSSRFDQPEEALLPSGSAALYRGRMIQEIGAFDPDFFLYCEDTDLGLRAQRAGWQCRYVPEAQVTHRYSHSAGRVSALKAYYVERNRLFLIAKNFTMSMLIAAPFVSLARYSWHAISLFRGKGAAAQFAQESGAGWRLPWFVLKAHFALFANLGRLLRQRRTISRTAKISDPDFRRLLQRFSLSARKVAEF